MHIHIIPSYTVSGWVQKFIDPYCRYYTGTSYIHTAKVSSTARPHNSHCENAVREVGNHVSVILRKGTVITD